MYLLFDIGGTKMRLALSRDGISFEEPRIVATPRDFEEGMTVFTNLVSEVVGEEHVIAAAGGIAGPLDRDKTMLVGAPNLAGWIQKPLKTKLEEIMKAPVYLENDTAMVGLGEATTSAGKGYSIVAYVTISTGVNGVRIVDGKIDRSAMGFEIGHQVIDMDGAFCSACQKKGHLEAYISGSNVEARFGKKPYEITDPTVWDELARYLAYGLNNTIVHWSPDIVVLGGSMMKEIGIPIERVRHHLKNILTIFPEHPKIEKATLGDVGGLWGALAYVKQQEGV